MKTDFFDIVAGVLLAPYLFIICLDYVLKTSIDLIKENVFTLKKARSRQISRNITDADYADDIALLPNTPIQAESQLHILEQAAVGVVPQMNADETEYICFNQEGDISTLNGVPLKLVDKFTYLGSSISSSEKNINMHLATAWIATVWLSITWKSDVFDKLKQDFF